MRQLPEHCAEAIDAINIALSNQGADRRIKARHDCGEWWVTYSVPVDDEETTNPLKCNKILYANGETQLHVQLSAMTEALVLLPWRN